MYDFGLECRVGTALGSMNFGAASMGREIRFSHDSRGEHCLSQKTISDLQVMSEGSQDRCPPVCVTILKLLTISFVACLMVGSSGGCQKAGIRAANLPNELVAPLYPSPDRVDLSQLTRNTQDTKRVTVGDLLTIDVSSGLEKIPVGKELRVNENGDVNVPIVGPVTVIGQTMDQAEATIHQAAIQRQKFVNPVVTVTLKKRLVNTISIFGAVKQPGTYEIDVIGCDLAAALAQSGGMTALADTVVEIKRPISGKGNVQQVGYRVGPDGRPIPNSPGIEAFHVDLTDTRAIRESDLRLTDGSIVMVKKRKARKIFISGFVETPQQIEIPPNEELRLLDAITMAGGRKFHFAEEIKVIRQSESGVPVTILTSYNEASSNGLANMRLADGDIVSVGETVGVVAFETFRSLVNFGVGASVPLF